MDLSFFAEMAWKSALIAGAALALAFVLRSRAAADRASVLRIGVAMLLLLPLIALMLPALPVALWAAPETLTAAAAPIYYVPGPEVQLPQIASAGMQPAQPSIWDDPTPLVLLAYLGGLAMVGGRLLAGLWTLRRWTRDARPVTSPEWLAALGRVSGGDAMPRLMVSDAVPSPLSWGFVRPVILIDPDTLDEPEEADAILAHEMAHIVRRDWPVLMLTRIASTLFWFNPLVWLLEREIVQQAEEAADCEAAVHVEPARYAQTLLSWAQVGGGALPANSIAPKGSALGRRIRAILDGRLRERPTGSALARFAVMLCVIIAAPIAATKLVQAAAPTPPATPVALVAPSAPPAPGHPVAPPAPPAAPGVPDVPQVPDVAATVDQVLAEVLPQIPEIVASATSAVAAIDPEAIDEAIEEARPHMSRVDRERVHREVRRAIEQGRVARVQRVRMSAEQREQIRASIAQARAAAGQARSAALQGMAQGADGMVRGADGMEQGARQMEETANRLRTDAAYREQQIARARAHGETVTHAQLIEAAEGMREGAQEMRDGAREMREAAERMRHGDTD